MSAGNVRGMTHPEHPAGRRRLWLSSRSVSMVQDTVALDEWWQAERAAADRDRERARFYRTAGVCLVALTATLVVGVGVLVVTA